MKKYFIEIEGGQSEAFTLDELKDKKLLKTTLVWYEGLEDWTQAGAIAELDFLFVSVPPPLKKVIPPVLPKPQEFTAIPQPVEERESFLSSRRNKVLLGSFSLVVFVILLISFTDKSKVEAEGQLQENTLLIQQQQQQLEEQNAKIAGQQRLEQERQERERKAAIEKRMGEVNEELTIAYTNLEAAKRKLNDASSFQLLRSASTRNEQVNTATENVRAWEKEIEKLEDELKDLRVK